MTVEPELRPLLADERHEGYTPTGPMKNRAASAARWSLVAVIGKQGMRALLSLALARVLGPDAFGVIALAAVFMAFMAVLLDQGVAATVIQHAKLSDHLIGTAVWMTVGVGICLAGLAVIFAGLLATGFRTPELRDVLRVLSISVVLEALIVVPDSLLIRQLRLRAIALRDVAAAVVAGGIALGAAIAGAGYWAFVIQIFVTDLITLVVVVRLVGRLPVRATWSTLKEIWAFSSRVFCIQALALAVRNADSLIVARSLGPVQLAYYALSYRTMLVPIQALTFSAGKVGLPVYSRLQESPERFRRAFMGITHTLAIISFPLMTLCIVSAPIGVELVLGPAWTPAVPTIQILAVAGAWQGVASGFAPAFIASDRVGLALRFQILNAVVTIGAFAVGIHWGIVGVATGFTVVNVVMVIVMALVLRRVVGITAWGFARLLLPSVASALVLAGTWLTVEAATAAWIGSGLASLVLATAAGLAAFVATYFIGWNQEARSGLATLRLVLGAKER